MDLLPRFPLSPFPLLLTPATQAIVTPDKAISYSTIRWTFRRDQLSHGVEPSKFGLHSLRSGGTTMAANNGVNDRIFQRHGRWKSAQAKDTNADDDLEQRFQVSRFLGL